MRRIFFAILVGIFIFATSAEAAKVDMYRAALLNKNFTLKYEIVQVPVYQSMQSGMLTFRGELRRLNTRENSDTPHGGIIVVSGEDRYTEIYHNAYEMPNDSKKIIIPENGNCTLLKNGDIFQFIWTKDGNKRKYNGKVKWWEFKSSAIKANVDISRTPYQDLLEEFNYGVPEIALVFLPLLPREKIIATSWTPDYKFFNSGSLANGLTYEDFVSDKNNFYSAIRYYFDGNNMVKVAIASYVKENGKVQSYEKKVINITEFSPAADQNYLKLPEELKDITQRDKEISK